MLISNERACTEKRPYLRFRSGFLLPILALVAQPSCTGSIGADSVNNSDGIDADDDDIGGGGKGGSSDPDGTTAACDDIVPEPRIWRLSPDQFRNSISSVLGVADLDLSLAPGDSIDVATGFANNAEDNYISDRLGTVFANQAEIAATKFIDRASTNFKCLASTTVADVCVSEFIATTGRKLWRRPLSPDESTRLSTLFRVQQKASSIRSAIKVTTHAMLLSPNFLYRSEIGSPSDQGMLTQHEIASMLSYSLTDGPPTDALLAAADAGLLADPQERARFARVLASTPEARSKFADFIYWQMQLYKLDARREMVGVDITRGLIDGNKAFVADVLQGDAPNLSTLMTSNIAFPNASTAAIYGVSQSSKTPVRMVMPEGQRFGLFTQPGWLTAISGPIHRGKVIKSMFLCQDVAVPANVDPAELLKQLPALPPDATEYEAWEAFQENNPGCASCHKTFHPLGLSLENYDKTGKFRETNLAGKPIVASGEISDAEGWRGSFSGPGDLIHQIVDSQPGQACFAERYLTYLLGRSLREENPSCASVGVATRFADGQHDLVELIVAATVSEAFVTRRTQ